MVRLILPVALFVCVEMASAGNAVGRVGAITVANDSHAVLFQLDREIDNTPRCNESKRFSIHLQKPGGMAAYMALLSAKQHGYTVLIEGLNNCANEWKSEDVKTIILD
ncbi:MAG: hypothetical protein GC149_08080 [Gammaproteobacteria bacterium]|nr:hypothetical protein [Gammaproteobacteria bacterium]